MSRPLKEMSFARQPLDKILSSGGSVRIMRALLAHGSYLSAPRVADDTHMAVNGVRDVLADLEMAGVVESTGSARARLVRAIPNHPIVAALGALFEAERARFRDILAALKEVSADSRISAAWLFGSVARTEDRVDSDWDVAMVVDGDAIETARVAGWVRDLVEEHERRLGFTASIVPFALSDIPQLASGGSTLWSGLLNDAQVLKGPEPRNLAERAGRRGNPALKAAT